MKEYIDKYIIGEEYEAIRMQLEELLRRKVKNCKNSTIIFDTKDYVLLDDIIDAVSKILSQYVSDTTFADAFRSISGHYRWRKVSEELPDKPCEVLVMDSDECMYIAYFSYGKFILDRYTQINGDIREWKPID